jgi:glucose/arabinose dehydrogenase
MRATAFLCCAVLLLACAKAEEKTAADSAATTPAPAAAPAPAATLSLADLAGKWKQETRREGSDSVLVTSEIVATADPSGWTMTLPNRPTVPFKVTVDGDSIITASGPFESVLRKGVQVSTTGVLRKQGDKLVGLTVAHYKTTGADSVTRLPTTLTRVP